MLRRHLRLLRLLLLAEFLQLATVLRQPELRYAIPTFGLLGLNLLLIIAVFEHVQPGRITLGAQRRLAIAFVLLVLGRAAFDGRENLREADSVAAVVVQTREGLQALKGQGCTLAAYYGSSWTPFALMFGDRFAGEAWGPTLNALYPDFIFYNVMDGTFGRFAGTFEDSFLNDFGVTDRCLVLVGAGDFGSPRFRVVGRGTAGDMQVHQILQPGSERSVPVVDGGIDRSAAD